MNISKVVRGPTSSNIYLSSGNMDAQCYNRNMKEKQNGTKLHIRQHQHNFPERGTTTRWHPLLSLACKTNMCMRSHRYNHKEATPYGILDAKSLSTIKINSVYWVLLNTSYRQVIHFFPITELTTNSLQKTEKRRLIKLRVMWLKQTYECRSSVNLRSSISRMVCINNRTNVL